MAQPFFTFKKFVIHHDKCAMKVGTDAVLIGSWTDVKNTKNILDIGTGCGIIALMLAQRSAESRIVGIDIEKEAVQQANENFDNSPYKDRIIAHSASLQSYAEVCEMKFDLIVSNPPYFINSLKCPDKKRNRARHTDSLTLEDLFEGSKKLISEKGRIALVLPYEQKDELLSIAKKEGYFLKHFTEVIPTPASSPKRLLVEFSLLPSEICVKDRLTIELSRHVYTDQYIELTKDFYLKM